MLNPSNQVQKNLMEEDSSGSDDGSEVSLEPETDRFGFILTNGSTAGVGPPPELVRHREAKWISIMGQWERILLKKSHKVKLQCQKGIPASLRAKCWPLLCGATDKMKRHRNLYQSLDTQPGLQSWVDIIERDLDRQFPFHEMFQSKDGHGQRGLFRVLKAYTQYQPEEGYCQAQGPVAAVLLMNMPAEDAFWCLVQISEHYLPAYYSPLLEGVLFDAAMLSWVLKKTCPAAHKHLQEYEVEPLMFATDWLMCLFTRHLPFNTLLRVWDLFFCYGVRVLLQVAVVLVRRVLGRSDQRKQCQGQMETLEKLRGVREQVLDEDDAFIAEVCSVPLSTKDLDRRTEKELEKWKKVRPSSKFDPRGRCYGYRMVWAKARQVEGEQAKVEGKRGNLSVSLVRSVSSLSLSPSLLRKKWRKGGRGNAGDWEGSRGVVRHYSMSAKEDLKSWTNLDLKNVQGIQEEEAAFEGFKPKREMKLEEETKKTELLEHQNPQESEELIEQRGIVEQTETIKETSETKEIQHKETECNIISEQAEEIDPCLTEMNTDKNTRLPANITPSYELEEKITESQARGEESKRIDSEGTEKAFADQPEADTKEKHTRTQLDAESSGEEGAQTNADSGEETITRILEATQLQVVTVTNMDSGMNQNVKEEEPTPHEELKEIPENDLTEENDNSTKFSKETETKETLEDVNETKVTVILSETHEKSAENVSTQADSDENAHLDMEATKQEEIVTQSSPECTENKEDLTDERQTEAPQDPTNESGEATIVESVKENEQADLEQNREIRSCDQTRTEDIQRNEEKADVAENEHTTVADPSEQIAEFFSASVEMEAGKTTNEDDAFTFTQTSEDAGKDDTNTNIQITECETLNNVEQSSGPRSNRASGDFHIRKSSSSCRSQTSRRLSQDLFTIPLTISQAEISADPPETHEATSTIKAVPVEDEAAKRDQHPESQKHLAFFRKLKKEGKNTRSKTVPQLQVPKILIQDFSDGMEVNKMLEEKREVKLSSRERRRRRRECERKEKEERLKEKDLEKKKKKTREKNQEQKEKAKDVHPTKTGSQTLRHSATFTDSYF